MAVAEHVDFPTFMEGGKEYEVPDRGLVIGGSDGHAAIWTRNGGWVDLLSLLSPADAGKLDELSWWSLTDVNNAGMILANVTIHGTNHAVLFTPQFGVSAVPEPESWALALMGIGALAALGRRQRGA